MWALVAERIDLSLILPAYNEVAAITGTLTAAVSYFRARQLRYEILVVADGDDGTREAARVMAETDRAIIVMGDSGRHGKGRAVRTAALCASGDIIGFADADAKIPFEELDKALVAFGAGCDLVIGTRAGTDALVEQPAPAYRRAGSIAFAWLGRALIGLPTIDDTQCGFKFFTHRAAREIFSRQTIDGYMFDVEVLVIADTLGLRLHQVPVRWRSDGDSRLELVAGNVRNLQDLLRIRRARTRLRASKAAPNG